MVISVGYTTLVVLMVVVVLSKWIPFRVKRMPPGPRPWPIIGNMLMIRGKSVLELYLELSEVYGRVFTLWIGFTPLIIVMKPEVVNEALIQKAELFHSRPKFQSVRPLNRFGRGILTASSNRWKFLRKLLVQEFLSNARVKSYKPIRGREIELLVENIAQHVKGNTTAVVVIRKAFRFSILNIFLAILFGMRLEEDDLEKLNQALEARIKRIIGQPRDHIPFLKLLPSWQNMKDNKRINDELNTILGSLILERMEFPTKSRLAPASGLVDALINLQTQNAKRPVEEDIVYDDMVLFATDVLTSGMETTVVTLEYALAHVVHQPQLQEKLWDELKRVVGLDRVVEENDISNLPILQSVVKEVLRLHPPAPTTPRVAQKDCKLGGYDVPAGALIITNFGFIARNPDIWDDASQFLPERFMNKKVDITRSIETNFMPFGVGQRVCPGANLALLNAHIILARLIQSFRWYAAEPVDFTPQPGFLFPMKRPLQLHAHQRTRAEYRG